MQNIKKVKIEYLTDKVLMNKPEMVRITPSTEWKNLKYIPLRLLASAKTFPDNLYHGYGII